MKTINRIILLLSTILIVSIPAYNFDFSIKLAGGFSLFHPEAINRSFQDWVTWQEKNASATKNWNYLNGEASQFTNLFSFEGELLVNLHKNIAVSLGTGYLYGEVGPEKNYAFVQRPLGVYQYDFPSKVSATPIIITGYYILPFYRSFSLFIKAGAGLIWAKYFDKNGLKKIEEETLRYPQSQSASAKSPIVALGAGITLKTESGLDFFLESTWRLAKMTDFQGENSEGETGSLYYLEAYDQALDFWRTRYLVLAEKPAGDEYRTVEKAKVDLSGFTLKLGLMIRF